MRNSKVQLVSILRQVSLSLNTEPLRQFISLREIAEETDHVAARLSGGKRVTPAQIYELCAQLWMARMKAVEVYGRHSDVVMSLERQTDLLEAAGNVWICPYISRHLLSLNPLLACCRRYSRGER
ncbi:outer membrane pore protein [Escherichia coli]|nr:outer membrane pore protein [Escherichia coli]